MMPENENTTPAAQPSAPVAPRKSSRTFLWSAIAFAALVLAGWQWLETRQKLDVVQQELARQMAEAKAADVAMQQQHGRQLDALQARLTATENKLGEFQGLYQDMARGREEATLLEVEQAITLAAQQLQLAANVPVAVLALQTADARLARLERPAYLPLRKAVAKDLERLNAVPFVDVPGISLHLEQLVQGADAWPLSSLGRPAVKAEAPVGETQSWWQRTTGTIWQELKGLVRIQRFDREETVLLAPGQAFFLRENFKLRLLNARLALLAHDGATFRGDLKQAQDWLGRHFSADDKGVQAAQAALRQMAGAELNAELPNLNETQAALRALRNIKEKR